MRNKLLALNPGFHFWILSHTFGEKPQDTIRKGKSMDLNLRCCPLYHFFVDKIVPTLLGLSYLDIKIKVFEKTSQKYLCA